MVSNSEELIASLNNPSIYQHDVSDFSIIETHISWVVLTGMYAYKIKKPIKYSFVDFSTLEMRKFYCEEELRLNKRLAPNLYLQVIAITGSIDQPSFSKNGNVIEYAVKMLQFPQAHLLSYLSIHKQLSQQHIDEMANEIANFHFQISSEKVKAKLGLPEDIHHWVMDNFLQIEANLIDKKNSTELKKLRDWCEKEYLNKYDQFLYRRKNNFIRECHGDMHLGNMVLIKDKVTIFDGIDFNEHLRWIDVISEIAFTTMDLNDRGYAEYANRLINLYLQHTGDYQGLVLLKYYLVYRAMVRAKVAVLRLAQKNLSADENKTTQQDFDSYLTLASQYISAKKIALIITHGFSGSGKSTHTEPLLESIGAIRIRSDVERKRLHGYGPSEKTQSSLNIGIYSLTSSKQTYARLAELSKQILTAGFTVIVDACFLHHQTRQKFYEIAEQLNVPFIILDFQASENTLKHRITSRPMNNLEPSEADLNVLQYQIENDYPFLEQEKPNILTVNTEKKISIEQISSSIKNLIEGQAIQ